MKKVLSVLLGIAGAVLATNASAQNAPVNPSTMNVFGDVQVWGGIGGHMMGYVDEPDCQGCHNGGEGFGGLGRAAWTISPALSMQLDVWAEHWAGLTEFPDDTCTDCTWDSNKAGIATHFSYRSGNFIGGALASIGTRYNDLFFTGDEATYANLAVEGAFTAGNFRIYGQIGTTFAVGPDYVREFWMSEPVRNVYGRLVGTLYVQPNFLISANIGGAIQQEAGAPAGTMFTWGARIEFQPNGMPLYFLAAYQGSNTLSATNFLITDNVFRIGFGLNVNNASLQARDATTGLADYNCYYGIDGTPAMCTFYNDDLE